MSEDDVVPGAQAEVAATPPATDTAGSRRPLLIVGVAVAVLIVLVVIAVAVTRGGSSSKTPTATLESAGEAGDNPFTDSIAVGKPTVFPKEVSAIITQLRSKLPTSKQTQTLVATGTAPGVYGGNGSTLVCNSQALIDYLRKNPGNAAAWSKAIGVQSRNIANFVNALTPVVLTMDTRVTNNGYDNATIAPRQSILQAGTAVLVDTTGLPRVACASGNPLTATRPIVITKTKGDEWSGFDPKAVTTITAGPAAKAFTLIDAKTGKYYQQPTGNKARGGLTGRWVLAEPNFVGTKLQSTTIRELSPGQPWTESAVIPGEGVVGIASGDGKWVAVTNANYGGRGNHVLLSTDLRTWKQVAAFPNRLSAIAFGNGRWTATALHEAPALGPTGRSHTERVIYSSTDAVHWTQVAALASGTSDSFWQPVGFGHGEWLTAVPSVDATSGSSVPRVSMFTSQDGTHWTANGSRFNGSIGTSLAFGDGKWTLATVPISGAAAVNTSSDGVAWAASSNGLFWCDPAAIAFGTDGWLAIAITVDALGPHSTFLTSPDAKVWTRVDSVPTFVWALAYVGPESTASSPTGGPSTTASSAPTPPSAP